MNSAEAKARFARDGTQLHTRAVDQHAVFAERCGALLRAVMHLIESQCILEGIAISLICLICLAMFAVSALTTVGQKTPYQAVYGRQPPMLPPIRPANDVNPNLDSDDGRAESRIREIAISSMVEATSISRISIALRSRTSAVGADRYNRGDLVDI